MVDFTIDAERQMTPEITPEQKMLLARIRELQEQHRELDSAVQDLLLEAVPDELRIKRSAIVP